MRNLSNTHIEYLSPGLMMPEVKVNKSSDKFTFFFNFDVRSTVTRKNVNLLLKAFIAAFSQQADVELLLKLSGTSTPAGQRALAGLDKVCEGRNIRYIDEFVPYHAMLALIVQADCYVSCHRSEGLGLGLLEAMSLGVPCIATAFGGNTEFMSNSNAILLRYALTEVRNSQYERIIDKPACWAEPDLNDLITAMRALYLNPSLRERLSLRARRDAQQVIAKFWQTDAIDAIFNLYQRDRDGKGSVVATVA
jgi:glycosyltransferase involved in cell wall biosynthesis